MKYYIKEQFNGFAQFTFIIRRSAHIASFIK